MAEEPTSSSEELEVELVSPGGTELPEGEDPARREGERLLPLGKPVHDPRYVVRYPCLKQMLPLPEPSWRVPYGQAPCGQAPSLQEQP